MTQTNTIALQCKKAATAAPTIGALQSDLKNKALTRMADAILENETKILNANQEDVTNGRTAGLTEALIDRLTLNHDRLVGISDSLKTIVDLQDPIGEELTEWTVENGLNIRKIRVPLGVIGIIYEARPNVTADAIGLCLKTGNSVVLRGSSSAYNSNRAIVDVLQEAAIEFGVSPDAFQLLEDTTREGVSTFVQMNDYLNLIIPRGGAGLIQNVVKTATVPTIETGVGNCHVYVHEDADIEKAKSIVVNAKTHRPSVCNAAESLLVDASIAQTFLPLVLSELEGLGVEIRGCDRTCSLYPSAKAAVSEDWDTEFLDLIISVKVVDNLQGAIDHIENHGTLHTEAIISTNKEAIQMFSQRVDASAILINASTRFTDGGEFGFGAEIGISTQKLHARGPMGLTELTSYKYIVEGDGQVRP